MKIGLCFLHEVPDGRINLSETNVHVLQASRETYGRASVTQASCLTRRAGFLATTAARARCPLDLTARIAVLLVAHTPDSLVTVLADKQAAIFRDRDSHRAPPDFAIGRDETGHEVFIFAARFAG